MTDVRCELADSGAGSPVPQRHQPRSPAWLSCPELAEANRHWQRHPLDVGDGSPATLRRIAARMLRCEIGLIDHAEFSQPGAAEAIFAEPLALTDDCSGAAHGGTKPRGGAHRGAAAAPGFGQLCAAKLLSPAQEALLFRRMNFLRHQALKQRGRIDPQRPSAAALVRLHQLTTLADWHRDRIVEANTRLVFSIVKKFVNPFNQFDDLVGEGIMALMRAVDKFDFGRGFRFSTYATQVVRRGAYRMVMETQGERSKLVAGVEEVDGQLSDEGRQSAISESRWHELRARLAVMLGELDRRERFIIRTRFSLGAHRRVHTLQELALRLGVSKERVRQLEMRAMEKLRGLAGQTSLVELEA